MYKELLIVILSLSMILSIMANNNPAAGSESNDGSKIKDPDINVSWNAVAVGFSARQPDGLNADSLSIKEILLMAENYCLEQKIAFPIRDSRINISIGPNEKGTRIEVIVYFQHSSHKLLKIIINNRKKVSTHTISSWFAD